MNSDVHDLYRALVEKRKACGLCPGLTNPASVRCGSLDSAEIGPYSTWQADLDAELMIVGKDFAPVGVFEELGGRPGARVQTNLRLRRHLQRIGFEIGTPADPASGSRVFLTNAVLCLPGGDSMRTSIPGQSFETCGQIFLRPLIELVQPRAIVTLGSQATTGALRAFGLPVGASFESLVTGDGIDLTESSRLFPVPHPVASRTRQQHEAAWDRVGDYQRGVQVGPSGGAPSSSGV